MCVVPVSESTLRPCIEYAHPFRIAPDHEAGLPIVHGHAEVHPKNSASDEVAHDLNISLGRRKAEVGSVVYIATRSERMSLSVPRERQHVTLREPARAEDVREKFLSVRAEILTLTPPIPGRPLAVPSRPVSLERDPRHKHVRSQDPGLDLPVRASSKDPRAMPSRGHR